MGMLDAAATTQRMYRKIPRKSMSTNLRWSVIAKRKAANYAPPNLPVSPEKIAGITNEERTLLGMGMSVLPAQPDIGNLERPVTA
jgi:hypothetical protein